MIYWDVSPRWGWGRVKYYVFDSSNFGIFGYLFLAIFGYFWLRAISWILPIAHWIVGNDLEWHATKTSRKSCKKSAEENPRWRTNPE